MLCVSVGYIFVTRDRLCVGKANGLVLGVSAGYIFVTRDSVVCR